MDHYYQTIYFKEKLFRTSAVFMEQILNITVFENETAWSIQKEEIAEQSKDRNFNEYYDNLKGYFRLRPEDVEFDFMHGKLTINLLLKNKMKILFFTSTLTQVNFVENIFDLVDKIYTDKSQYYEEFNKLGKQHKILQKDNKNLKEKIDIFLERKKTEEQKQYSRFFAVLNEKKQHIQHLSDLLTAFRKGRPTINSSEFNKGKNTGQSKKNVPPKKINIKTESECDDSSGVSDNDYNTKNEEADNREKARNISDIPITNTPGPSTSLSRSSLIEHSPTTLFKFSKRIRTDGNLNLNVHLPEKIILKPNKGEANVNIDCNRSREKELNPTVNFSTQDVLDNL